MLTVATVAAYRFEPKFFWKKKKSSYSTTSLCDTISYYMCVYIFVLLLFLLLEMLFSLLHIIRAGIIRLLYTASI